MLINSQGRVLTGRLSEDVAVGQHENCLTELLLVECPQVFDDRVDVLAACVHERQSLLVDDFRDDVIWLGINLQPYAVYQVAVGECMIAR